MIIQDTDFIVKLEAGIKKFKFLALKNNLVKNKEDFAIRFAFDTSYNENNEVMITYLLLKEGKEHRRYGHGGYDHTCYDCYEL